MTAAASATQPINARKEMAAQVGNPAAPAWFRLWAWTWVHTDTYGHAKATAGELRTAMGLAQPQSLTRALEQARARGLLDAISTARCLVLPGHALAPCPATHRDGS